MYSLDQIRTQKVMKGRQEQMLAPHIDRITFNMTAPDIQRPRGLWARLPSLGGSKMRARKPAGSKTVILVPSTQHQKLIGVFAGASTQHTFLQPDGELADRDRFPVRADEFSSLSLEDTAYHATNVDLSNFGDHGERVDSTALPPRETANALWECFCASIHLIYPVVSQRVFVAQYRTFRETSRLPHKNRIWLGMLNIMFAIGRIPAFTVAVF